MRARSPASCAVRPAVSSPSSSVSDGSSSSSRGVWRKTWPRNSRAVSRIATRRAQWLRDAPFNAGVGSVVGDACRSCNARVTAAASSSAAVASGPSSDSAPVLGACPVAAWSACANAAVARWKPSSWSTTSRLRSPVAKRNSRSAQVMRTRFLPACGGESRRVATSLSLSFSLPEPEAEAKAQAQAEWFALLAGTEVSRSALVFELVAPIEEGRGGVAPFPAGPIAHDQLNDHSRILTQHMVGDRCGDGKIRTEPLHLDTHRRAALGAGPQRDARNAVLTAVQDIFIAESDHGAAVQRHPAWDAGARTGGRDVRAHRQRRRAAGAAVHAERVSGRARGVAECRRHGSGLLLPAPEQAVLCRIEATADSECALRRGLA